MNNLPSLATSHQQQQLISQIKRNILFHENSQIRKPTTASQSRNLSPFTWTNIKLPSVIQKDRYQNQVKQKVKLVQSSNQNKIIISRKSINNNLNPSSNIEIPLSKQSLQIIKEKKNNKNVQESQHKKQRALNSLHQKVLEQYQKRKFTSITASEKRNKNKKIKSFSNGLIQQNRQENVDKKAYMTISQANNIKPVELQSISKTEKLNDRYKNITNDLINNNNNKNKNFQSIQTKQQYLLNLYSRYNQQKIAFGKAIKVKNTDNQYFHQSNLSKKFKSLTSKSNHQYDSNSLKSSIIIKSQVHSYQYKNQYKNPVYNQMEPYMKKFFLNLNNKNHDFYINQKLKIFVTSNPRYHPMHQTQYNASAFSNNPKNKDVQPQQAIIHHHQKKKTLIWTKNQLANIFRQKSNQQFYNHIQGSHILTSKQKLHEILHGGKGISQSFYPRSFSIPKDYNDFVQQCDFMLVKITLKQIINKIREVQNSFQPETNKNPNQYNNQKVTSPFPIYLSQVIDDLIQQKKNDQQLKLLKICFFLQQFRKKHGLVQYFQKMINYRPIQISLTQSMYADVIDWCLDKVRSKPRLQDQAVNQTSLKIQIDLQKIDYRLIQLLKAYNYLFLTYLPSYLYKDVSLQSNIWILKPFASSKAAGISLLFQNQQFFAKSNYFYRQLNFKSKYQNRIIMKYISNPLLIKHSAMDYFVKKILKDIKFKEQTFFQDENVLHKLKQLNHKIQKFMKLQQTFNNRKFDIRQWILIVCDNEQQQSKEFNSQNNRQGGRDTFSRFDRTNGYNNKLSSQLNMKNIVNQGNYPNKKKYKIYCYHTAYCRFAKKQYNIKSEDLQVHLTNYQLYKSPLNQDGSRRSVSPNKNEKRGQRSNEKRSLNSSIVTARSGEENKRNQSFLYEQKRTQQLHQKKLQKSSQHFNHQKMQNDSKKQKEQKQKSPQKTKNKKQSIPLQTKQKQSVLMLDQLFEYLDFFNMLKNPSKISNIFNQKKNFIYEFLKGGESQKSKHKNSHDKHHYHHQPQSPAFSSFKSSVSTSYSSQLTHILSTILDLSQNHFTFNNKTFQLFGVDVLFDQNYNLYLEQINLNPGCAVERNKKLESEVDVMLQQLLLQVMLSRQQKDHRQQQQIDKQKYQQQNDKQRRQHKILSRVRQYNRVEGQQRPQVALQHAQKQQKSKNKNSGQQVKSHQIKDSTKKVQGNNTTDGKTRRKDGAKWILID